MARIMRSKGVNEHDKVLSQAITLRIVQTLRSRARRGLVAGIIRRKASASGGSRKNNAAWLEVARKLADSLRNLCVGKIERLAATRDYRLRRSIDEICSAFDENDGIVPPIQLEHLDLILKFEASVT